MPLVSVFIPAYNKKRFIEATLDSVRLQTFRDFELILVDDYSTDGTAELIQAWIDRHAYSCIYEPHKQNKGLCATMNEGVRLAQGKYFCVLGSDDIWHPEFLEKSVARIESLPDNVAVVYGDSEVIDDDDRVMPMRFLESIRPGRSLPEGRVFDDLLDANFVPVLTAIIRLEHLRAAGDYDESLYFEDYDMWLRLAANGHDFVYLPEALTQYREGITSMRAGAEATVRMWLSTVHIKMKWVGLSKRQDRIISDSLSTWPAVRVLYSQRHPFAMRCALGAFKLETRFGPLPMLAAIALHVPYKYYVALEKPLRKLRGLARKMRRPRQ